MNGFAKYVIMAMLKKLIWKSKSASNHFFNLNICTTNPFFETAHLGENVKNISATNSKRSGPDFENQKW